MGRSGSLIFWAAPAFVLLWATGFVGAKFGLPHAEPFIFLAIRFTIASMLLALWAVAAGEFRAGLGDWRGALTVGALIHAVYLGGVFGAIAIGASAAVSALIVGLQPILTAGFAHVMLGERMTRRQWLGMALGLAGVSLVIFRQLEEAALGWGAAALCVMALFGISYASILQKRRNTGGRLALDSSIQFASAAVCMVVASLIFEEQRVDWTTEFLLALSWMVMALSLGAITLLYLLIRTGEASKTASLFFLVPGVTACMAWAMFGETFGPVELAGLAATAVGVWLVTRGGTKRV